MKTQAATGNAAYCRRYKRILHLLATISWSIIVQRNRARLCVSAVFAVAPYPSVRISVCLSVCLSVTFVNYIKTARDVVKFLSPPSSTIILLFASKRTPKS